MIKKQKSMRYKKTVRLILISVIIVGSIGLFYSNVLQPPFIHINDGKSLVNPRGTDSIYIYTEDILVAHPPKDTLERMKMMINYYDTAGVSLVDLKKQGDITFYYMGFSKNTCATRKFHLEKQRNVKCNDNETYIGSIGIVRSMEGSPDKWKISISYNLGTETDADYIGCKTKDYILYDERDSNFYERHKDDEIVRYYHQLQERKRHTKSEPKSEQEIFI